jgi:phenylpropionate dioxygenase-like ring-hydroxylating dioxygenase large terminal subunit
MGDEVWREPVANYRAKERLDREIQHVLRKSLAPFCPSAALPERQLCCRGSRGTPIVAVRGRDGVVRAFRNVCRHRGMEVVSSGAGCSKVFVCGYHGWAYGLDGRLQHVPHEHGFPGLDKETHGLVPVHAVERQRPGVRRQESAATSPR